MAKARLAKKTPTNNAKPKNNKRTISHISNSTGSTVNREQEIKTLQNQIESTVNQVRDNQSVQRQEEQSNTNESFIDPKFDEFLDSYKPIRDLLRARSNRINSSQDSSSTVGASDQESSSQEVARSESEGQKETISVALDIMRTLRDPGDLKLANVGCKSLKCLWPVRRIHNMTGLSTETQEQVRNNGFLDNHLHIKEGVELYARVIGNTVDKWYIFNLARKKVVDFDDKVERKKIDEQLNKKENKDRKALKEAMVVAQQMLDNAISRMPKATEVLIDDRDVDSKIASVSVPKEKNVPMPHQLQDFLPMPVEFRTGMMISYSMPVMGDKRSKIVEIRYDEGLKNFALGLEDSYLITDDVLVGAGNNKVMFPFSTLRDISTFIVGKEGSTAAERTFEKLAKAKEDLLATLAGERKTRQRKKTSS